MKTMTNRRKGHQLPVAGCRSIVVIATILPVFALFAERQPYERYQSVVDRQMFGQPPPGFDPTKNPSEVSAKDERAKDLELTKEQEQVKSSIHFSVINVTPTGETAVGFTDNSDSKSPKHYYLKVGESRDGWTVKEADALAASMTIAKGEIEVSLTLGGDSASGNGTKKIGAVGGRNAGGGMAARNPPNLLGGRAGGASRGLGSLRERRALREQQREAARAAEAEEKARAAEERERERQQREAEREAERAEREAEREEMQKKLKDMADAIRQQQEESAAKKEAEENSDNGNGDEKGDVQ